MVVTGGAEIKMFPASKLQVQQKCMKLQKHFKNKYKKKDYLNIMRDLKYIFLNRRKTIFILISFHTASENN